MWFRDREAELDKAEEAWNRAVETAHQDEPLSFTAPPPEVTPSPPVAPSPQRGPHPRIPRKGTRGYDSIDDYPPSQLVRLVQWIESDTLLRTEDDLLRAMMDELGFKRSGKRITEALGQAIRETRR